MSGNASPWQVLHRSLVYESPWIRLWTVRIRLPDGTIIDDYHVLDYPYQAVGVVPVAADGRVLLVDQYRFITDRRSWSVPSGRVDGTETLEAAVRRELDEEGGATAAKLVYLGYYNPSHGSSNQVFHLFVGHGVEVRHAPPDLNEVQDVRWFTVEEIRQMIRANELLDGLSLTALLWAMDAGYLTPRTPSLPDVAGGLSGRSGP
jgi:ADP-ribose pyrophosphatase